MTGCRLCGKPMAYPGAMYCGSACCARWEGGERPAVVHRFAQPRELCDGCRAVQPGPHSPGCEATSTTPERLGPAEPQQTNETFQNVPNGVKTT